MVQFRGIHHAGLVVDDLDAAITFYGALLEMEEVERDSWRAPSPMHDQGIGVENSGAEGVMLRGSNSYLEVWPSLHSDLTTRWHPIIGPAGMPAAASALRCPARCTRRRV